MKKLIFIFLSILIVLSSCTSSKKYFERGMYDMAINKSTKKLIKKPTKEKEIMVLNDAYRLANQKDKERIDYLRATGEPDVWEEIFAIYNNMKNRQNRVSVLPSMVLTAINYKYVNYDQEIIEAKKRAAEYFYANAKRLLEQNDRLAARQAYHELMKVKSYYANFRDTDELLGKALFLGTSNVLFSMKNNTGLMIQEDFEKEILKISVEDLSGLFINYDTKVVEGLYYDYTIVLNLKIVDVSPEQVKEVHYTDTKEVEGWEYKLDDKGNVMKDSLGNDIKVTVINTISCNVIESQQHKACIISGTLDYWDNRTKQIIKTDPITAENFFNNYWAVAHGNFDALSEETKRKMKNKAMPFPPDEMMILNTASTLKEMTKDIIYRNRHIIK
jgi:predicted RNA-binding protein